MSTFLPRVTRTFCGIAGGGAGARMGVAFFLSAAVAEGANPATASAKMRRVAARCTGRERLLGTVRTVHPSSSRRAGDILIAAAGRLLYHTATFAHENC